MIKNLLVALALTFALPLAVPAQATAVGIIAPTRSTLKHVIQSGQSHYRTVSTRTLQSKKFQSFIKNPANYQKINLLPKGILDASSMAFVAKRIYPGKVFVQMGSFGRATWSKGTLPKF